MPHWLPTSARNSWDGFIPSTFLPTRMTAVTAAVLSNQTSHNKMAGYFFTDERPATQAAFIAGTRKVFRGLNNAERGGACAALRPRQMRSLVQIQYHPLPFSLVRDGFQHDQVPRA